MVGFEVVGFEYMVELFFVVVWEYEIGWFGFVVFDQVFEGEYSVVSVFVVVDVVFVMYFNDKDFFFVVFVYFYIDIVVFEVVGFIRLQVGICYEQDEVV